MGALHPGHLSLISEAKNNSDLVVCSIFVNPAQFNDKEDLIKYPRTPERDIELLKEAECDILFMPENEDIYPPGIELHENVDFGELTSILEAEKRPGHFDGVINVVKRLFEIVKPDIACFGMKDYQQLAIIRQMVKEFNIPVEIIPCPIIREESGLARSSRNERLNLKNRKIASYLSKILFKIQKKSEGKNIGKLRKYGAIKLSSKKGIELEYLEFLDPTSFTRKSDKDEARETVVLVAAWVAGIRLIDNVEL